ncbi:MAG: hypothetical protein HYS13_01990 [Planctomycetia bacterium]|nr:hypothetical protein [Planctomycetia bacterium]
MTETEAPSPLLACARDLVHWLKSQHVSVVITGGLAVSLLSRPRMTRDVDAVVLLDEARWPALLDAGLDYGFRPRIADAIRFARRARVLLVRHDSSRIDADISFGSLPFEREAIARAVTVNVQGVLMPLPRPDDLIIMKAVAHRPRDLVDIEGLLDAHPRLDLRRARRVVRSFATALEMPELLGDLEAILSRRKSSKKRKRDR